MSSSILIFLGIQLVLRCMSEVMFAMERLLAEKNPVASKVFHALGVILGAIGISKEMTVAKP
jgi:Holliday junction resolvasome RuvABC endonuclease subunit